jgi:predicted dehydrogenase/nucleoside-diphosphate-sugar epimerase
MQGSVKFKVGIVGTGHISDHHVAALQRLSNVTIVGAYDPDADRRAAFAERHRVRAFESLEELFDEGADVIHVLTPPHAHAEVTLKALDRGCHVLVEKPLATNMADCERIKARSAAVGRQVCVNHSLLFDPQVRRALDKARSGKFGKIVSLDFIRSSNYPPYPGGPLPPQYRSAGYPFRDLGIHALYLFEAFLGPIRQVSADWISLGGEPNLAFDEWRALVHCRDGIGQFQLSWNARPLHSQLIVHGTKGGLHVDLFSMYQATRASMPLPKAAERVLNAVAESLAALIQVPMNVARFAVGRLRPYHGLGDLVHEFYRSLENGSPPPVSVDSAIPVVEWVERVASAAEADFNKRRSEARPLERADVLVTGASGGLGSVVVERLRARGKRVRILVRRMPDQIPDNLEVAVGDLGDPEAVSRAMSGVISVVHCGAAMRGGWSEHLCGTVTGTTNVLDACRAHGVNRLVHISSLSVLDWAGADGAEPVNEDSSLEPYPQLRGFYTRAKLEAELLVSRFAKSSQVKTVILRPGQIFGGPMKLVTAAVARRVGNRMLVLGNGNLALPLVHVDDVVDAIELAIAAEVESGSIFQIVDPYVMTQNRVLSQVAPDLTTVRVPRALLFVAGKLSELPFRLLRRQSPLALYRLRSALARLTFDGRRADESLGWRPRVGVVEGIHRQFTPSSTPRARSEELVKAKAQRLPNPALQEPSPLAWRALTEDLDVVVSNNR